MGETLYEKTIEIGSLPKTATVDYQHHISNIDNIISIQGFAYVSSTDNTTLPLPNVAVANIAHQIVVTASRTYIRIVTGIDRSSYYGFVTISYTKTT